jgi:adenosylcobinamide kinase / adenosylcobinamide-phosphate guanylyltransferase
MTLLLLLGGARSGKSALAVRLARARGGPVWVVATGEPRDDEMAERIRAHRSSRPSDWRVVEEPRDLVPVLDTVPPEATLILDCLTLWVSNLLERYPTEDIVGRASNLAAKSRVRSGFTIAVSNEVGLGLVTPNLLGRAYRDLLGQVNSRWADAADEVLFLVAGRAVRLEPVDAERWGAPHV